LGGGQRGSVLFKKKLFFHFFPIKFFFLFLFFRVVLVFFYPHLFGGPGGKKIHYSTFLTLSGGLWFFKGGENPPPTAGGKKKWRGSSLQKRFPFFPFFFGLGKFLTIFFFEINLKTGDFDWGAKPKTLFLWEKKKKPFWEKKKIWEIKIFFFRAWETPLVFELLVEILGGEREKL